MYTNALSKCRYHTKIIRSLTSRTPHALTGAAVGRRHEATTRLSFPIRSTEKAMHTARYPTHLTPRHHHRSDDEDLILRSVCIIIIAIHRKVCSALNFTHFCAYVRSDAQCCIPLLPPTPSPNRQAKCRVCASAKARHMYEEVTYADDADCLAF